MDGTVAFYSRVQALLPERGTILDVGCGRGWYEEDDCAYRRDLRKLTGPRRKVLGLDVDPTAECNPFLDEFRHIDGLRWPVETDCADLVLCDCVLEHISDPARFFSEAARTLKPSGYFCARTTNALSYVGLTARLVPNRLHSLLSSFAQESRSEEDVFPTVYKCNSRRALRGRMEEAGLRNPTVWGHTSEPNYLTFSSLSYAVGTVLHRFLPSALAPTLFAFSKGPSV